MDDDLTDPPQHRQLRLRLNLLIVRRPQKEGKKKKQTKTAVVCVFLSCLILFFCFLIARSVCPSVFFLFLVCLMSLCLFSLSSLLMLCRCLLAPMLAAAPFLFRLPACLLAR